MKHIRDFHSQSWNNPFFARRAGLSRFKKVLITTGAILFFGCIVFIFIYSPFLRIGRITVTGNETVNSDEVRDLVNGVLNGYDYLVLPKNHHWVFATVPVKNILLARFGEIRRINIEKKFDELIIVIEERKPTFRLISGDRSYFLDQEGIGMKEALVGEGDNLIAISQNGLIFSPNIKMLPNGWSQSVLDLHKYFATQTGVRDQLIWLDPVKGLVQVVTNENWYAIIDPLDNIKNQLSSLSSALLGKFNFEERKKLEYIDVRFGDKIFYKWK